MDNAYWTTKSVPVSFFPLRGSIVGMLSLALDPDCLFQVLSLPFISCVTLGKLLNHFVLQLPHL